MDTLGLYGLIAVASIVIAVGARFVVYTVLVRNSKWLPEQATKLANITCLTTITLSVVIMVANAWINHAH